MIDLSAIQVRVVFIRGVGEKPCNTGWLFLGQECLDDILRMCPRRGSRRFLVFSLSGGSFLSVYSF